MWTRPAGELDDHHLARRRTAFLSRRHEDIHQHPAIERRDVAHAVVVAVVAADDRRVGALEDADDASFGAAAFLDPLDTNDDAVAVHRLVQERARDVNVAAVVERPFGRDEAVAGRVRLQPADIEVHLLGQPEAVPANLNQIAGGDERFDVAFEGRPLLAGNFENLQELAHAGRVMHPLAHDVEHLVA